MDLLILFKNRFIQLSFSIFIAATSSICASENESLPESRATVVASHQTIQTTQIEPPHSLYKFFGLFNLQALSRDLRRKLIPLCFCGSVERNPIWEQALDPEDTKSFEQAAFSKDGSLIAYSLRKNCMVLDRNTMEVRKVAEGDYSFDCLAFNPDASAIAYGYPNGKEYIIQQTHDSVLLELLPTINCENEDEGSSSSICSYDSNGRLIIAKASKIVVIVDPKDSHREFFFKVHNFCLDDNCRKWSECAIAGDIVAFCSPHNQIEIFSLKEKTWKQLTELEPEIRVWHITLNQEGTLLAVMYSAPKDIPINFTAQFGYTPKKPRRDFYGIKIFEVTTGTCASSIFIGDSVRLEENNTEPQGFLIAVEFLANSQFLLLMWEYATVVFDSTKSTMLAKYPHGPKGYCYLRDRGYYYNPKKSLFDCDSKIYNASNGGGFTAQKQFAGPLGDCFITLCNKNLKLYTLPALLKLYSDNDSDKGALERILFLQYLKIITRLGLILSIEGIVVPTLFEKCGKQGPQDSLNKMRTLGTVANINELKLVYNSFPDHLRMLLKKKYNLPWE